MPKTRTNRPSSGNVTASHSGVDSRHIRTRESDAPDLELAARIKELVGDDTNVAFAAACGFSEGMLRKYLKGARPGPQYLSNMAAYRNVNIQWLATGTPPKTRQVMSQQSGGKMLAMQYMTGAGDHAPNGPINAALLRQCLHACNLVHGEDFIKTLPQIQLIYATDFYNQLVTMANAQSPARNLDDFCRLEIKSLADQLQTFLRMGWARKFPYESELSGTW